MVETKGNNQEKKRMSRHHLDVVTPKGYEGFRDTTLRSRQGFVYEATREVFAKEKRLQLVFNIKFHFMSRHQVDVAT